jgi:hypothetical protein
MEIGVIQVPPKCLIHYVTAAVADPRDMPPQTRSPEAIHECIVRTEFFITTCNNRDEATRLRHARMDVAFASWRLCSDRASAHGPCLNAPRTAPRTSSVAEPRSESVPAATLARW